MLKKIFVIILVLVCSVLIIRVNHEARLNAGKDNDSGNKARMNADIVNDPGDGEKLNADGASDDLGGTGQFKSRADWLKAVKEKAVNEYYETPVIKKGRSATYYAMQTAGLIMGLHECTKEDEFNKIVSQRTDLPNLVTEQVDCAILAYSLHYINDKAYPLKSKINYKVLKVVNVNIDAKTGTLMYRKRCPSYRFVDTIGLVCPFLAAFAKEEKNDRLAEIAVAQIIEFEQAAFVKASDYLPFHAVDLKNSAHLGKQGWGRGTGWYALGLIDTYSEVDDNNKAKLKNSIIRLSGALVKYQKEDGGWGSTLNVPTSRTDTSATALNLYFIKRACKLGVINKKDYSRSIRLAEKCLINNTGSDGLVMNTEAECRDLGNYSPDYIHMPFTQGMTLRAAYTVYE